MKSMVTKCLLMACDYQGTPDELRGCQNDARNLADVIVKSGAAARNDITVLKEPTLARMRDALAHLVQVTNDQHVDQVFISWSGHGTFQCDTNGDEDDGRDECLCPVDYHTKGGLVDDELCDILSRIDPDTRVAVFLDCCHSGTAVDLPWRYTGLRSTSRSGKKAHACHPNTIAISGCRDDQTSADAYDVTHNEYAGAMTRAALDVLEREPSLLIDAPALVLAMRVLLRERKMVQVPQLTSSREHHGGADVCVLTVP